MSNDYRLNLLSEELDKYKVAVLKLTEENERLKETNLQLQTIDMEIDRNNKYHKALEEIRGIIRKYHNTADNGFEVDTIYDIETKINEVLNERN